MRLVVLFRIVVRLVVRRDGRRVFRLDVKRLLAGKRRDRGILGGKALTDVNGLALAMVGKAEFLQSPHVLGVV